MRLSNTHLTTTIVGIAALLSTVAVPAIAAQQGGSRPELLPSDVAPLCRRGSGLEQHPEMCRALRSLYRSRQELNNSAHDYNGLRVKALQEADQAISDVTAAIKSDQK